jgi:EAL domain-containing protein (putative c-di-GMP-specific phosphodiesterase class I)
MYQAKAAGRATRRFFDAGMQAKIAAFSAIEADLRSAVEKKEFMLHYQPQIDRNGHVVGAEGLIRWPHSERGMVMPGEFIPVAETSGLILPIGYQVLEMAAAQLIAWSRDDATRHLSLAVNVSARQYRHPQFVEEIRTILGQTGADPKKLKLELTESLLLQEVEDSIEKMMALTKLGVNLSLDDFGTGYSSLAYLKQLPLSQVKIDRSFVQDILTDTNDAIIARTIIVLAKSLGLKVIAEGVEDHGQWEFLHAQGCDEAQGYLFGRPMPAGDFIRFVRNLVVRQRPTAHAS